MNVFFLDSTFIIERENGDVRVEKVQYDTDFMPKVFERRKRRDLEIRDSDDGEKVSIFNYIKESSVGKCKASGSRKENEVIKNRRKRNVFSASRKHFSSDFAREKRRAEQQLMELQHQYLRCNKNAINAPEECKDIYFKFMQLTKEINEKFHQFATDNFADDVKMENENKKIDKKQTSDGIKEIKSPKKAEQPQILKKNNENVGKTYFGDGFYSYTYDQIPRFHEDLNEKLDNFNNKQNREQIDQFQTQNRPETTPNTEQQGTNFPVKVPDHTGEDIYYDVEFENNFFLCMKAQVDRS